jgi:MFS family permease
MSIGLGAVFVAITTAANAGVPPDKAGLAAALVNTSQQLGGALGLAIFSALSTSHTHHLLATGHSPVAALDGGLQRALFFAALFVLASAAIALRSTNTRGEPTATAESLPALT